MAYGRGFHGTLCTICDLSYLEMTLNVDELDISDVEVGQIVTITADAVEDTVYTGVVTNVSVAGNTSGGIATYPVTIRIDETDGLRPGMNVDAEIVISSAEDVLAVPRRRCEPGRHRHDYRRFPQRRQRPGPGGPGGLCLCPGGDRRQR